MADDKQERAKAIDAALAQIDKQFGKGSIMRLGSREKVDIPAIPTGSLSLDAALGAGTLAFNDFSGVGRPGIGTLRVDGKDVASKKMERTLPMILQWDESFDIGSDTLTGVNDADYTPPFPLTAKLNKLTLKVNRPKLSPADEQRLKAAQQAAADQK